MATQSAVDINNRPAVTGANGNAITHEGKIVPTVGTSGTVWRVLRIPAGTRVDDLVIVNDACDTNGSPTLTAKIGYTPVSSTDGPAAVDNYWALTGSTILRAAGRTVATAKPITFDYDVYVDITLTANAATLGTNPDVIVIARGVASKLP